MKLQNDVIEFLEQSNFIEDVRDGLDDAIVVWNYIVKQKTLTKTNILRTHKLLMLGQPLEFSKKGAWRKEKVWIGGHEAKPWYAIPDLMDGWVLAVNNSLIDKYVVYDKQKEGIVKSMHIAFESIHPFVDGNGRMGRILMNWQRVKMGLPILIIKEEDRFDYYKWFE